MTKEMADDLHCSCQRATQISRLRPGAKQSTQLQAGSSIFCPENEFDVSQAFISLSSANSHSRLQDMAYKCCSSPCPQRTLNSTSDCPSRSMLRKNSSSTRTKNYFSSVLQHQLRVVSCLLLLSLSLFHQVDLTTARAMGNPQQPEHGQHEDTTLPVRCTLPFSNYDCGSIASVRYTYLNGSCQRTLEWIGGSGCEYDGTENSFATEQECLDVCLPASPTTAAPPNETAMNDPGPTPTSSSQSEGSTDADIATISSVDETPTVDTTICFLPIEENCPSYTFPTSYFYYDLASLSCLPKVVFCPMSGPNIFDSLEDCRNACERPLTPTTTTETPTTTEAPPTTETTTTDCPPPLITTEDEEEESPITRTTQTPKDDSKTTEPPLTTTTEKTTPTSKSPLERNEVTTISPNFGGSSTSRPGPSFVELNKFDLASVGLGMMAFLLIVILVGVVLLSIYRRHARLRRQKQEVMDSKKSEVPVRTLAFTVNRHEKPAAVQTKHCSNTSTSTTSSTLSSYLTTV